ncbi:DEAD/DEAH box helicase [Butyrivibrio sp. VCB2006]|uniref:DEAD/DEAH box helicase n=1 Tax=Butyrivibrio sp. VCB2006 TaxID=1280679 RepID=UPI0003FB7B83|nr:ATP-binding protein [Butyrivibrio sp. VCB2006]
MRSNRIKFANEFCFMASIDNAEGKIKTGIVDYQIPQDDLFIKDADGAFIRVGITAEMQTVISRLRSSYGRALLRADLIDGADISFTLMEFSDAVNYDEENPLRIVIDQAIAADLMANDIEKENAANEMRKQLIVDEGGKYLFAYKNEKEDGKLQIVGDRYTVTIVETPQHYLHIIQIIKRTNKSRIDSPIMLVKGNIEIVDEINDAAMLTARADEQYAKMISSDNEFISLWNLYNELEMESIKQEASEMGFLKYKGFRYANGVIVFSLDKCYTRREFCIDNMYYVAIQNIDPLDPLGYNFKAATIVGSEIDYSCVNTNEFRIKEDMDTTCILPSSGYLLPSLTGSEIQRKRRLKAQRNILSNKCRLPGLKSVIQGGVQVGVIGRRNQPISADLEQTVFENKEDHFTEKQKHAIDVAINTPDIAVIQGPPGTGKTSVIKAIVKRIDELSNSKAKILITSTQHDAVDNAVKEVNYGGVPVNRIAVRKGREDGNYLIYDWIDKMMDSCEGWLAQQEDNSRSKVRELFEKLVLIETSNDYMTIKKLLEECDILTADMELSPELHKQYAMVISELASVCNAPESEENPLPALINGQRLSKEAYLDDGAIQLKQLERYLKFDSELEFDIPDYWKKLEKVTDDCAELDGYLENLKADCERLEALCPGMTVVNNELLDKDIQDLIRGYRLELVSKGNDDGASLANIIWEFKQELTNSNNVDRLIRKYSKINAATCQQSANPNLSPSMEGFDDDYDFVIVDEAARSNPLDLLIPMSMGKKIILVGDHKQLPHMVERDIVEAVASKIDGKNVETVLEESLFMRLNALIGSEDKKLGIDRTAMLTEQYRMHPDICELVNVFYDGKLDTMCKIENKQHNLGLYDNDALVWIDLPLSEKFPAEVKKQSASRKCEVDQIQKELSKILAKNSEYEIGIITFYSKQAELLNEMVRANFPSDIHRIQVGTVDAFQGKEFDVVLLSVVRANREKDMKNRVGFLNNNNRLCVAFSRAKRLLIAVGDSETVAFDEEHEYVKPLLEMYKKSHVIKEQ